MSSDRELLEAAAKAAGYETDMGRELEPRMHIRPTGSGYDQWRWWNPLVDDGDALRLAVKLHLTCRFYMGETTAQATVPGVPAVYITDRCHRRAIVRAAAEIGCATQQAEKS